MKQHRVVILLKVRDELDRIRIAEGTPDIIAGDEMRPELEIAAADIERESRRTVFRRHHVTEYESSGTGIPHLSILLPARIRETIEKVVRNHTDRTSCIPYLSFHIRFQGIVSISV